MYEDATIDFETLGVGKESLYYMVTDVAVLPFNIDSSDTFPDLVDRVKQHKFLLKEQQNLNWVAETGTMDFWKNQSKELQKTILPSSHDVKLRVFIEEFIVMVTNMGIKRIWCRGMNFDIPILQRIFQIRGYDIDDYIHYSQYNDVRTFIRAFIGFEERDDFIPETASGHNFIKHKSDHDVAMDVMRLQYINNM